MAHTERRALVVLADEVQGDEAAARAALRSALGARAVASTGDHVDRVLDVAEAAAADAVLFTELGVATVAVEPGRRGAARRAVARDGRLVAIEPGRAFRAVGAAGPGLVDGPGARYDDDAAMTWGLRATGVERSRCSGRGVAVAVLDSGIDRGHPDVVDRPVVAESFVAAPGGRGAPGTADEHGHGTHCAGTATGPPRSVAGRRYGVAGGSTLLVGKVLGAGGDGDDTSVLAGIGWALAAGARVVSLSFTDDPSCPGTGGVEVAYETVARRALDAGVLMVAAAGDTARRTAGDPGAVGLPARAPSVLSVAALRPDLRLTDSSPRGRIDVVAPGAAVYSSWRRPDRFRVTGGTSMAAPHVAGLAALWSEATGTRGRALRDAVVRAALPLPLAPRDAGAGLARAPE